MTAAAQSGSAYGFQAGSAGDKGLAPAAVRTAPLKKSKKTKVMWTPALHACFVRAVHSLAPKEVVPSKILEVLGPAGIGLTRQQVSSHLQKYRQKLRDGKIRPPTVLPDVPLPAPPSTTQGTPAAQAHAAATAAAAAEQAKAQAQAQAHAHAQAQKQAPTRGTSGSSSATSTSTTTSAAGAAAKIAPGPVLRSSPAVTAPLATPPPPPGMTPPTMHAPVVHHHTYSPANGPFSTPWGMAWVPPHFAHLPAAVPTGCGTGPAPLHGGDPTAELARDAAGGRTRALRRGGSSLSSSSLQSGGTGAGMTRTGSITSGYPHAVHSPHVHAHPHAHAHHAHGASLLVAVPGAAPAHSPVSSYCPAPDLSDVLSSAGSDVSALPSPLGLTLDVESVLSECTSLCLS